jgi:hypothetical protein
MKYPNDMTNMPMINIASPTSGLRYSNCTKQKILWYTIKKSLLHMPVTALLMLLALAILPEGTVKDEATFLFLLAILAAFVGAAIYLRIRKGREEEEEEEQGNDPG